MGFPVLNVQDKYQSLEVSEIQNIQKQNQLPYSIALFNVDYDINISTIIRSACTFGATRVLIFGKRRFDLRGCVGSQNYIEIVKCGGLNDDGSIDFDHFCDIMDDMLLTPVYIETGDWNSVDTFDPAEYKDYNPCLVFGNEKQGIPPKLLSKHNTFCIPQVGVMRSLNVGIAASIAMYEVSKKWKKN